MSGFVYIWYDRKHKRYYVGSHWGSPRDGYICSSSWMKRAQERRPCDFKRRILATVESSRSALLSEEQRWLDMIKFEEKGKRYYNLTLKTKHHWHIKPEERGRIGVRISAAKRLNRMQRFATTGEYLTPAQQAMHERPSHNIGRTWSDEHKAKISERVRSEWENGVRKGKSGWKMPVEAVEKIRRANTGKTHTEKTRQKLSKTWIVTDPQGNEQSVVNLKQFCLANGLTNTNVTKSSGSRGWRARRTEPPRSSPSPG